MLALFVFVLVFSMLNFFSVYYLNTPLSPVALTGQVVENGVVKLYVEGGPKIITIDSPLNVSYDFAIGSPYLLNLNITADFFVDDWNYSLYDLEHDSATDTELEFTPNITITATRWSNRLTVAAHETDGDWISKEVVFYINVPNSEPVLGSIDSEIFACEGESLSTPFNASDVDEEVLTGDISPKNPFYVKPVGDVGLTVDLFEIYSRELNIVNLEVEDGFVFKSYNETISAIDESGNVSGINSVSVNITVIEVNNPVTMTGIGAQTVYFAGENASFEHQMLASDHEDGASVDENLTFNLTFDGGENKFTINSTTGLMNYTPSLAENGSVFYLTVCVSDNALASSHSNFEFCSDKGYSNESTSVCDDFSLTVTDDNRAPSIDSYTPVTDNFSVAGTAYTVFSVVVSDPDGTIPDIDWYVDGVLKEENEAKSTDDYSYSFGCGVRDSHNVSAVVSDGVASVVQTWDVDVSIVACPVDAGSGGGGGGGGGGGAALGGVCVENWACGDWDVCQNVERSFLAKSLSPEDYYSTKELCAQNQFDDRFCGLQLADCIDVSICNNSQFKVPRPLETRVCYFTENPSCEDSITNCHSGGCELLVDCGGPCEICPTCSDGKQNQGEGDVDCGGPCPYRCEAESPFGSISFALIGLLIVLIAAILFIGFKLFNIWRYGAFIKRKKKKR